MQVFIPNNHQAERSYILNVLLGEFLGIKYQLKEQKKLDSIILELPNGNQLFIKDAFFNQYPQTAYLAYLKKEAIPTKVEFLKSSPFIVESDLPIIYGQPSIEQKNQDDKKTIHCLIDIFASAYFMLTRWEECISSDKDEHHRFPASASLAYKHNFLHRPIVNEYVELLWSMLSDLGLPQKRRKRKYQLLVTHDIDFPLKWHDAKQLSKEVLGDVLKRKQLSRAKKNINAYFQSKKKTGKDPYDTFDFLMDVSEKKGVQSHFFFLSGGTSKYDSQHPMDSSFLLEVYQKITQRGHIIGFHPSYESFLNKPLWKDNYEEFKAACPDVQACGRQHFLKFDAPLTWQIWEDHGMEWDSTLGYAEEVGFRCGTCYEFPVFNFLTKEELHLIEKPLIWMDVTLLLKKENMTKERCLKISSDLVNTIKKYNGTFNLLWHNSSFDLDCWSKDTKALYQEIIALA